jgi:hypothetical protein
MKTLITAAAFAAVSATSAAAWTIDQCPDIADASYHIVEARDAGTDKGEVYVIIAKSDMADDVTALLLMIADMAYDNNATTPNQMKRIVLTECRNQFSISS